MGTEEFLFVPPLVAALWFDVLPHMHSSTHFGRWRDEPVQTHAVCTYKKKIYFHVSVPYDLVCLPELITEESSSGIGGNEKQT